MYSLFVFEIAELTNLATPYDVPAKIAFANAALGLDPANVAFDVWSGDLRIDHLAVRITAASVEPGGAVRSHTESVEEDIFLAIIDDFVDSLTWTTCDPEKLRHVLTNGDAYSLAAHPVLGDATRFIDNSIRALPAYIGCAELDLGNPLHHETARILVHRYFLEARTLKMLDAIGSDDELELELLAANAWAQSLDFTAVVCDQRPSGVPLPRLNALSERGLVSAETLARRDSWGHFDEVALALTRTRTAAPVGQAIGRTTEPPRIDERKLRDYCLTDDPGHAGYPKSQLFRTVLGIERADWRFLAAQLEDRLFEAAPQDVQVTAWGVKYRAQLPIVGRNGQVREITTAWIIRGPNPPELIDPPALVTAFLPREDAPALPPAEYTAPPILRPSERHDHALLHEVAKDAALTAALARPERRDATVELLGDSDFAQWLVTAETEGDQAPWVEAAGLGPASEKRDASFCATYAKVLRQNGVPARATTAV